MHGTTVATNALLEHKGAKVGLLTTEGHRDVIEMREGLKDDRYNLRMPPPEQLVPRALRLGVTERMRADGTIETPLDRASLAASIEALKRAGVEAVAVCYLHAYRDPRHERETAAALAEALPDAYVSLSVRRVPADQGVRPRLHHGGERLCRAGAVALSGPAGAAADRGRLPGPDPDHPVAWRRRADRRSPRALPPAPCCPALPAASPAAATPRSCWAATT